MKSWRWLFLLVLLITLPSCAAAEQRVVTAPMDAEPETQPNVALGYVLQYVNAHYGENEEVGAPPMGLNWVREYIEAPQLPGATALRFFTDTCTATVTYTAVDQDDQVYHVVVDDSKTGFHWCGEVDAAGNVREIAGPSNPGAVDVPPTVLFARAAVLDRLRGMYPAVQLPGPTAWRVEGGPDSYIFTSDGWRLALNRPVTPTPGTLFNAAMTNSQSGFQWQGVVDEFCHVP